MYMDKIYYLQYVKSSEVYAIAQVFYYTSITLTGLSIDYAQKDESLYFLNYLLKLHLRYNLSA